MNTERPTPSERAAACFEIARDRLLAERHPGGHWIGELSTSALSTATAVMALEMVRRGTDPSRFVELIAGGLRWLAEHQNPDGGWGDTVKSHSNISTTMLAHATFRAVAAGGGLASGGIGVDSQYAASISAASAYITSVGGVPAVVARYGKDRTFSVPILTHCALAGLMEWRTIPALPFELACLPPQFYKTVRLPVVSYALPALIAIGQVRHHFAPTRNPLARAIRNRAVEPTLRRLIKLQPASGGFLEAAPLTSFVTMSLAGMGRADHPVAKMGVQFLLDTVRPDGSWPIDTNLATWTTTLSVNALRGELPENERASIRAWLLGQQYRDVHPFTNADPGGWAWTDLSGGVPDADDTPGAMLAVLNLRESKHALTTDERQSLSAAATWLMDLQNRDGGWPTFCRGWGTLPFDRSAPDLTAHALRALFAWQSQRAASAADDHRITRALERGLKYLAKVQRDDGSWLPLWFGNQDAPDDINPVYGTARVLAAYRDLSLGESTPARRGIEFLTSSQNSDGGWGGVAGVRSSVEETAVACDVLAGLVPKAPAVYDGIDWLCARIEDGTVCEASPIGFYFAKLWYFETLYPLAFTVSALRAALARGLGSATE